MNALTNVVLMCIVVITLLFGNIVEGRHHNHNDDIPPATVPSVVIESYMGLWFQMYSSFLANQTYEKDSYCNYAVYSIIGPTSFDVTNAQRIGSPTGPIEQVTGKATLPDVSSPGE
jgi:lipocalin